MGSTPGKGNHRELVCVPTYGTLSRRGSLLSRKEERRDSPAALLVMKYILVFSVHVCSTVVSWRIWESLEPAGDLPLTVFVVNRSRY